MSTGDREDPLDAAAVVLAAGKGSRLGGVPKALLTLEGGETFLARIVRTLRTVGIDRIVVVVGPPHQDAVAAATPEGVFIALNPHPERGMFSSIRAGVSLLGASAGRVLVWPVDSPGPGAATVAHLLAQGGDFVVPVHGGRGGHPVVVRAALVDDDPGLVEDSLRARMHRAGTRVNRPTVQDPFVVMDVDTAADLERLRRELRRAQD